MRRILRPAMIATLATFALFAMPVASPAQPPYPYLNGQAMYQDYVSGRIGLSQPYNVWLGGSNGLHIRMHDGTVIRPVGTTLTPGMRLRVWGHWNDDGTFEADQIDVLNGYTGGFPNGSTVQTIQTYTTYGNSFGLNTGPGYLNGSVSSFSPYNLYMGTNGSTIHVTLHDGTVISPTGITLQPGMRVQILGYWNGNGTFEANQIDVLNPGDFGY